jgi:citrate synthase
MTEIARGLAGVVITETRMSRVDGEAGELIIGGFPLEEIAPVATYEETLYLMWNDLLIECCTAQPWTFWRVPQVISFPPWMHSEWVWIP